MKTVAIIQARMGSTRLPGKVLMGIAGQSMLGWVVARVRQAQTLDKVIVATSACGNDDPIAATCRQIKVPCFRGSEEDVLDRYYHAARQAHADGIVRITADCPLIDPDVIDTVVTGFRTGAYDYVSNIDPPTFPDGMDTEVFSRSALERAWSEAKRDSEREHVTPYLREHPDRFKTANIAHASDLSSHRWTVDGFDDLAFVRAVVGAFCDDRFRMRDVCQLLSCNPMLRTINSGHLRNEGYRG